MCKLQLRFQITDMTLESKVKVTYTLNLSMAHNAEFSFVFLTKGVHIWHNNNYCLWCVDYIESSRSLL